MEPICDSSAFVSLGFWIVQLKDVCRTIIVVCKSCLNQEAIYSKLTRDERIAYGLILGFHYKIDDNLDFGVEFRFDLCPIE